MRRRIFLAAVIAAAIALIYAGADASSADNGSGQNGGREFPLPEVPSSLTKPAERADYLLTRFWDGIDFSGKDSCVRDTAFMEQSFVDFLNVMPHASSDSVRDMAVGNMLSRAASDSLALDLTGWLAETYLNSTDSPMYSEGTYIMFLDRLAFSDNIDEAMHERYLAQLRDIDCNRPGVVAADFTYTDIEGHSSTLLELAAAHDSTLLVFYDPDCHDCHALIDSLNHDEALCGAVGAGAMAVMALYPYDDTDLWRSTAGELPAGWIVAQSTSAIEDEGMYYLPRTPRTYLLDRSGRILRIRE